MEFAHIPVLFEETIAGLALRCDGIYLDGTAGGGGHSSAIAAQLTTGRLIDIDQDPDALETLRKRFADNPRVTIVNNNYRNMAKVAEELGIEGFDGILLDIGVSSHQIDTPERGFSFHADAPLDMRMSQSGVTAAELVNTLPWQSLAEIFTKYGEEKFSVRIAKAIEKQREIAPIETTEQLTEVIRSAIPAKVRREGGHPSRQVFQALRIAVNGELDALKEGLDAALELLNPGGRLAVITFHSLEDRICKQKMAEWCRGCTCPPEFPVCVCGNKPRVRLVNRKPIEASEEELAQNSRSRSAKLRVCEKL